MDLGKQDSPEHQLIVLVGIIPVGEGVASPLIKLIFVFQYPVSEMRGTVNDQHIVLVGKHIFNRINELVDGVRGFRTGYIEIKLRGIQTGAFIFGINEGYPSFRYQSSCKPQGREGFSTA